MKHISYLRVFEKKVQFIFKYSLKSFKCYKLFNNLIHSVPIE